MLTQLTAGQQDAGGGVQGVVVALGPAAGVAFDHLLGGRAVNDGLGVVGVGHARGGQFGQHRF